MPNYWTLVANPDIYEIDRAIREIAEDPWTTKGKTIAVGDRVAIWRAAGRRKKKRGIIAFGEVVSDPASMPYDSPYWVGGLPGDESRVRVRYVVPPGLPLLEDGPHGAVLDISAARSRGGTVFALPPPAWQALVDAAGGWPSADDEEVSLAREAIEGIAEVGTGQTFVSSPARRKLIEDRAMLVAREHYEQQGWDVDDVSATQSYDLHCTRDGEDLRVEVKGTTSDGWRVLLTPNEVAHAQNRYPSVALAVVSEILVDEAETQATVGALAIFEPWKIEDGELTPVGFTYRVPPGGDMAEPGVPGTTI